MWTRNIRTGFLRDGIKGSKGEVFQVHRSLCEKSNQRTRKTKTCSKKKGRKKGKKEGRKEARKEKKRKSTVGLIEREKQ